MSEGQTPEEGFKLRDHIGLLQYSFQDLLLVMIDTIGRISRDASISPDEHVGYPLYKYEDIPHAAEEIVSKSLLIDSLIDEAQEKTFLGKELPEITETLKKLSDEYKEKLNSLDNEVKDGQTMMNKIRNILDVVTENTPWLQQIQEEEEEDE